MARHQAKFHLDRLEAEGLLETELRAADGAQRPGAGRPSKLYRRAARDIAVSLPDREYELAGRLMAAAIAASAAHRRAGPGRAAPRPRSTAGPSARTRRRRRHPTSARRAGEAIAVLAEHGYEPRAESGRVMLANCPFHALALAQTELVCQMNEALVGGVASTLAPHCPRVALDPGPQRCCVVLTPSGAA